VETETLIEVSARTEPKRQKQKNLMVVERKEIEEEVIITTEITSIHPDFELTQEDVTETEQEMSKKRNRSKFL
jgi:hypothetical protein